MAVMVKFPDIKQFRNVVKEVKDRAAYHKVQLPKLKFNGSVKLHGTNASVVYDPFTKELWCQSRENVITPEKDNAGFARFVSENQQNFMTIVNVASAVFGHQLLQQGDLIAVYGEWCGKGIQKKVAINELDKMFVIFGAKIVRFNEVDDNDNDNERMSIWFTADQLVKIAERLEQELPEKSQIFSIQKFKTWEVEIDFAYPEQKINHFKDLTDQVEACCPVGDAFGVKGTGEGIVWRCCDVWDAGDQWIKTGDLIFKVKGEKHSDTKVKTTAAVDIEKINSIRELASNMLTDHRLEKMVELMGVDGTPIEIESTGVFLKRVGNDVLKEELDTIEGNGFTRADVMPVVNAMARQWYHTYLNNN